MRKKETEKKKVKKAYEAPSLTPRGSFGTATAGGGRFKADAVVGRLIP